MTSTASSSRSRRSPDARPEVDPEGLVLAGEPGPADAKDRRARRRRGPASPRASPCGPGCGRCSPRPSGPPAPAMFAPPRRPSPASPRESAAPRARRWRGGGPRSRPSPSRPPRRRLPPRGTRASPWPGSRAGRRTGRRAWRLRLRHQRPELGGVDDTGGVAQLGPGRPPGPEEGADAERVAVTAGGHGGQSSRWSWAAMISIRKETRCCVRKRAIDRLRLRGLVGVVARGRSPAMSAWAMA